MSYETELVNMYRRRFDIRYSRVKSDTMFGIKGESFDRERCEIAFSFRDYGEIEAKVYTDRNERLGVEKVVREALYGK